MAETSVLALAGGLLHDPAVGRQRVKDCLQAFLAPGGPRAIDVPPCGLVVPLAASDTATARDLAHRRLSALEGPAPDVALFRLPGEQAALQAFLLRPSALGRPGAIVAQLRGLDLDAYWRETPIWHFERQRDVVIGCDVQVNLRTLAAGLGLPNLLAPGNADAVRTAVAQALLRSFLHPQVNGHDLLFVPMPPAVFRLPGTWPLLEALPVAALNTLVVVLGAGSARFADLTSLIGQLRDIGIAACLAGVDWSSAEALWVPLDVAWLRGPLTPAMDLEGVEAALARAGDVLAIAELAGDRPGLLAAQAAGFHYATGPAVTAVSVHAARTSNHTPTARHALWAQGASAQGHPARM